VGGIGVAHGVRLILTYDGTAFAGWATQPGERTVQEEVGRAVSVMTCHPVTVRGASRTDAGVHAEMQAAAFDSERLISPDGWQKGLNKYLPEDISVRRAEVVEAGYNPRYDARNKLYRYVIEVGPTRNPLRRHRAWHVRPGLLAAGRREAETAVDAFDVGVMADAASRFVGEHDFRAFRASNDLRERTVRTLSAVDVIPGWSGDPRLLAIEVRGTAFLKNMVRILVGTLVEVGRQRMTPDDVAGLLSPERVRSDAGPTAPAHGLTLIEIQLGRDKGTVTPL